MRILIVEDSLPVARIIEQYVSPIASEVVIATDMQTAMEELSKVPPIGLVTLDLNLPDSGVEDTIKQIQEIKRLKPDCLLVIITGMVSHDQEKVVLEAGADGLMHKTTTIGHGRETFLGTLRDIAKSIMRVPRRYTKNIDLLEHLADKIAQYFTQPNPATKPT